MVCVSVHMSPLNGCVTCIGTYMYFVVLSGISIKHFMTDERAVPAMCCKWFVHCFIVHLMNTVLGVRDTPGIQTA